MSTETTRRLAEMIREYLFRTGISNTELAKRCGLSRAYFQKIKSASKEDSEQSFEPSLETLKKLANGMDMTLSELLHKAGYLDEEKRSIWSLEDFASKIPDEYKRFLANDSNEKYIRFAMKMKREDIELDLVENILALLLKIPGR